MKRFNIGNKIGLAITIICYLIMILLLALNKEVPTPLTIVFLLGMVITIASSFITGKDHPVTSKMIIVAFAVVFAAMFISFVLLSKA